MSKQLGIIIAIFILLAAGALAYKEFSPKTKVLPQDTTPKKTQETQKPGTIKGTINSLLSQNKNVTCTIDNYGDKASGQGVVFVSGKNIRGDFSTLEKGKRVNSHIIQNQDMSYIWGDSIPQGIKMKIDLKSEVQNMPKSQLEAANLDKEFNYNCINWTVNNSVFTPPVDIKFTDMTSIINNIKAPTTYPAIKSENACGGITDLTAKTACENAMKQ